MIADLDATIRQLLVDELPLPNGELDVAFQQPKREWSARLSRPTINCFLYDVRENAQLRAHQWEPAPNSRTRNGVAEPNLAVRKRSPLRIECTYLITAWAFDPGDEHRLLTGCLLALARYPVLPAARLVNELRNSSHEVRTRLASHELLANPAELWSALDNELRPGLTYGVTLALDPWTTEAGPTVRTLSLVALERAHTRTAAPHEGAREEPGRATIGGTVRAGDMPVPGAEVVLAGTGLAARTDVTGRFRFAGLRPGRYRIAVQDAAGAATREIEVPAAAGASYDLLLPPPENPAPDQRS